MNNKNKLILGCLTLLVLTSVGYALFSKELKITGSAKAKSDMDVVVTSCNRIGPVLTREEAKANYGVDPGESQAPGVPNNGEKGTCQILDDGTISTSSILNKPTDEVIYSVFIKNTGTKSISIKEVNSSNNLIDKPVPLGPGLGMDFVLAEGDGKYYDGWNGKFDEQGKPKGWTGLTAYYRIFELNENGISKYPNLDQEYNPSSDSSIKQANIVIKPNEGLYVWIDHKWEDVPNQPQLDLDYHMTYNVKFVFELVI